MTKSTKISEVKREWHLVDVNGEILGRVATRIASLLMGKGKPYFTRNLDCGDYVVATNVQDIKVTGKKEEKKKYQHHSGYPGGFKEETLRELRQKDPRRILIHAVSGMLPQNKLRDRMLKKLFVFVGEEHPYKDKVSAKGGSASGGKT